MQAKTISELLEKLVAGTLSEEERQLLHQLLQDPVQQELAASIIQQELTLHTFEAEEDKILAAEVQHSILQRIHTSPGIPHRLFRFNRWMAAAAVILLIAGVAILWRANRSGVVRTASPIPVAALAAYDLAPGGQRATLQLANGATITLDSATNGILAQQGKIKVTKRSNGSLSYEHNNTVSPSKETLYNTITTPKGGQYRLMLADGSLVWLNADSRLRYPVVFENKVRQVELEGEGYFEVAHHDGQPFEVKVRGATVKVLGTHFNINAYNDEQTIRTTLLEGKVQVSNGNGYLEVLPGQQATVAGNNSMSLTNEVNLEEVMAWKNGMFFFQGASLDHILRQAARWYAVEFVMQDNITQRFSGQISRNVNASQLLHILELTGKVHFEIRTDKVIVKQ